LITIWSGALFMARTIEQQLLSSWPRLVAYARSLTHEAESARDLMQQSALHALSAKVHPLDDKATLTWLFKIVQNAWIDQTRRRLVRRHENIEMVEAADVWSFDDRLINEMTVRRALHSLDVELRNIVILVDIEGFSYQEAATTLCIPIGTVMSRLHRARLRMLDIIEGPCR
jgi:RNA polymerase sigma-70 factor (ECF subfamily)